MKTRYDKCDGRAGAAFMTVMIVVLIISFVSSAIVSMAMYQPRSISRVRDYIRAKAIAEAGVNQAYSMLVTNFAARYNAAAFPQTSFGGGTYDVTVSPVGTDAAFLVSEGTFGTATARAAVDLKNYGETEPSTGPSSAWGHSIFANGTINLNGSGTLFGSAFTNQDLIQNGAIEWGASDNTCDVYTVGQFRVNGTADIFGEVYAPVILVTGQNNITATHEQSVPPIRFPILDLTELYNTAVTNGQVYSGGTYNSNVVLGNIPGGVAWFNGDVRFKKTLTFSGCVIATGDIRFDGSFSNTREGNLPAIISRDGGILINGSHTVEGLIYCAGDLRMNGSGTIEGSIVVGGNIDLNGSYGIVTYNYSAPPGVGNDGNSGDVIGISAWQE